MRQQHSCECTFGGCIYDVVILVVFSRWTNMSQMPWSCMHWYIVLLFTVIKRFVVNPQMYDLCACNDNMFMLVYASDRFDIQGNVSFVAVWTRQWWVWYGHIERMVGWCRAYACADHYKLLIIQYCNTCWCTCWRTWSRDMFACCLADYVWC